jgi:hypothetical protein
MKPRLLLLSCALFGRFDICHSYSVPECSCPDTQAASGFKEPRIIGVWPAIVNVTKAAARSLPPAVACIVNP